VATYNEEDEEEVNRQHWGRLSTNALMRIRRRETGPWQKHIGGFWCSLQPGLSARRRCRRQDIRQKRFACVYIQTVYQAWV